MFDLDTDYFNTSRFYSDAEPRFCVRHNCGIGHDGLCGECESEDANETSNAGAEVAAPVADVPRSTWPAIEDEDDILF